MAGYKDFSLSNNAVQAYKEGELPKSKAKPQIVLATKLILKKFDLASKENLAKVKENIDYIAGYTSYHHTGSRYNCTNFYSVQSKTYDLLQAVLGSTLPDEIVDYLIIFGNTILDYKFTDSFIELSEKTKKALT